MTLTFGGDGDKWGGTKRDDATAAVVSERSLAIQRAVRLLQRTFLPPVVPPTSVFPTHSIKVHWNPGVSEQGTPVIVWDSSTSLLLHGTLESINTRSVKASDGHVHVIDVALVRLPHGFLRAFPACHVFLSGLMHNGRLIPQPKMKVCHDVHPYKKKVHAHHRGASVRKASPIPQHVLDGFPDPDDHFGNPRASHTSPIPSHVLAGFPNPKDHFGNR